MRVVKKVNLVNIIVDNHSISKQTFNLACKIKNGEVEIEDLPPIKLENLGNGTYKVKDGRHRITAFKLLGIKSIKAKYHDLKEDRPRYVSLDGCCLRRIADSEKYYRHGGRWQVGSKIVDGKLISISNFPKLNERELVKVSEEEWRKCNGQYAPVKAKILTKEEVEAGRSNAYEYMKPQ